ncbi:amidase [Saccharopolyspora sp. K220]|uniref:amidase n=1 Tax=Saccharopolyspora soli TaxID=2926618 RepID=UPI001F599EE7|nr:amidase [Saccharopolyspora soli]MCI2415904.1 amidase [Saccharopolyspora soli]
MSQDLPLTIEDAAAALRAGEVTATQLTSGFLDRIAALNNTLGAFVAVTPETALEAAAVADEDFAAGVDRGPLQGIPLAVKDIIATHDAPTTANSRVLDPEWGKGTDAPVVARLRAAGSVVLGKSTTSEFAIGLPDPDKGFLVPRNPWQLEHSASGSSSGTGIAVAAGLALGGLGTDTGGSVRSPAAFNGHTGLKVTFGRVPKNGVAPLGYTLDSVGPMARSAHDCAVLLEVMAGYDSGDPCAARVDVPKYAEMLTGDVRGLRIGMPIPYFYDSDEVSEEVRTSVFAAVEVLKGAGAEVDEIVVPHAKQAKDANHITLIAEAYAYHRDNLVNRWTDYGRYTRRTLVRGAFLNAGDYPQAQRFRSFFRRAVAELLREYDVLITPSSPSPAPRIDEMSPEKQLFSANFTGPWNLIGLPAAALPCGFSGAGLPLSMQIIGKPFAEGEVLKVADAYQRLTDWHRKVPEVLSPQP